MTFFLPGGGTIVPAARPCRRSRALTRRGRRDSRARRTTSPSVEVRSDNRLTLAVERTMFWDSTHYGGHTANAVPRPSGSGCSPKARRTASSTPTCCSPTRTRADRRDGHVPARERAAVRPRRAAAGDASRVDGLRRRLSGAGRPIVRHDGRDAPMPITAERAMYFATTPHAAVERRSRQRRQSGAVDVLVPPEGASGHVLHHVHPDEQSADDAGQRDAAVPAAGRARRSRSRRRFRRSSA